MSLKQRAPALLVAAATTTACTLCIISAMSCNFLDINAVPGSLLLNSDGDELLEVKAAFGIFCEQDFYDDNDKMWKISRTFFYIASSLGAMVIVLALAFGTVLCPKRWNWRLLSFLCATIAVVQVPIFLLFESIPCSETPEVQSCSLSTGSYYLICSISIWVIVTLSIQCVEVPNWKEGNMDFRIPNDRDVEIGSTKYESPIPRQNSILALKTDSTKDDDFEAHSPRHVDMPVDLNPLDSGLQENTAVLPKNKLRPDPEGLSRSEFAEETNQSHNLILDDLEARNEKVNDIATGTDDINRKYSLNLRTFAHKLAINSKRRPHRRQYVGGYEQMYDDAYDSDSKPFSPPIEVEIKPFANFDDINFDDKNFSDGENKDLMNDWAALHRATTDGILKGVQDGEDGSVGWIDFTSQPQGYHSDPEPMYCSSDEESERVTSRHQPFGDSSTISALSGSHSKSVEGHNSRKYKKRRSIRQDSPAGSVRSSGESLFDVTIDEETVQDVLQEISDDEEAEGILGAYKLKRTYSEPSRMFKKDSINTYSPHRQLETISLNPSREYGRQKLFESNISERNQMAMMVEPKDPPYENVNRMPEFEPSLRRSFGASNCNTSSRSAIDKNLTPYINAAGGQRSLQSQSLSPPRSQSLRAETWKNDASFSKGMHPHRAMAIDDYALTVSSRVNSNQRLQQARENRVRRLQQNSGYNTIVMKYDRVSTNNTALSLTTSEDSTDDQHHALIAHTSSYDDGAQSVYSDLLLAERTRPLVDPDGVKLSATSYTQNPDGLPHFTSKNVTKGTPQSMHDNSSEVSPIENETSSIASEGEKLNPEKSNENEFPTMTTQESSLSQEEKAQGIDDFPVKSDFAMMTGLETKNSTVNTETHFLAEKDLEKFGSFEIDDLDLQLIAVQRPIGKEYGEEESSI